MSNEPDPDGLRVNSPGKDEVPKPGRSPSGRGVNISLTQSSKSGGLKSWPGLREDVTSNEGPTHLHVGEPQLGFR